MTITLTVADRIATISTDEKIVAGNTYPATLSLDSEWTGTYYVRVRFGSLYYDIPASGSSVDVQIPVGYPEVGLGIYSENIGICTNEVRVKVLRSILEQGVSVVEFDTDLYTQWQNEVSELVCDSDFDAESTRPVKNSVITAWKNTVPLDSALVHKTGNESIDGLKSFNARTTFYDNIEQASSVDYMNTAFRNQSKVYDMKDGQYSMMAHQFFYKGGNNASNEYVSKTVRIYKVDRSAFQGYEWRVYNDGILPLMSQSMYPVDGQGNPQAISANALESSGQIAVDPRLVHTTGNETIAGNKVFTATMNVKGTAQLVPRTIYDAGTPSTYYGWKGRISIVDKKDGVDSVIGDILCTSVQTYGEVSMRAYKPDRTAYSELRLRHYADFQSLLIPSHYPTSGGSPTAPAEGEAMSSGMIAVDPRIVHTTGNETVVGTKVFNGDVAVNRVFHKCLAGATVGSGWRRLYTFPVASAYARQALFTVRDDYNVKRLALKLAIRINATSGTDSGYNESQYLFKIARVDGHAEIWVSKGNGGSSMAVEFEYATAGGFPTVSVSDEQAEPPTVGVGGCTAVVDVQAW